MEQQRYHGMRVRESDAPAPAGADTPDLRWSVSTPGTADTDADATPLDPARERGASSPDPLANPSVARQSNAPEPAPVDEATADDQVTLLAERQPGASAAAMPTPQRNGNLGAVRLTPPTSAGSNSATLSDAPIPWNPPQVAPLARPARPATPPQQPPARQQHRNVPWQAAESWGPVTFTIEATTAAGASYLFWWLSGLLMYFNERHNRYVRFHAMQSILLTGALTVVGVIGFILSALCGDLASATGRHVYSTLGAGIAALTIAAIVFPWLFAMIAAWTGNYLRLPIVGHYAERYAAPPIEPTPPPLY